MKHQIYLDLTIADFEDVTHDEISQTLGIKPFKIYIKGQKRNHKSTSTTPALVTSNRWVMRTSLDEYSFFEDHMNAMLDIVEPKIDVFKPFCEKYRCDCVHRQCFRAARRRAGVRGYTRGHAEPE